MASGGYKHRNWKYLASEPLWTLTLLITAHEASFTPVPPTGTTPWAGKISALKMWCNNKWWWRWWWWWLSPRFCPRLHRGGGVPSGNMRMLHRPTLQRRTAADNNASQVVNTEQYTPSEELSANRETDAAAASVAAAAAAADAMVSITHIAGGADWGASHHGVGLPFLFHRWLSRRLRRRRSQYIAAQRHTTRN